MLYDLRREKRAEQRRRRFWCVRSVRYARVDGRPSHILFMHTLQPSTTSFRWIVMLSRLNRLENLNFSLYEVVGPIWVCAACMNRTMPSSSNRRNSFSILNSRAAWNAWFWITRNTWKLILLSFVHFVSCTLKWAQVTVTQVAWERKFQMHSHHLKFKRHLTIWWSQSLQTRISICLYYSLGKKEKKKTCAKHTHTRTHATRPNFIIVWYETWLSRAKCLAGRKQSDTRAAGKKKSIGRLPSPKRHCVVCSECNQGGEQTSGRFLENKSSAKALRWAHASTHRTRCGKDKFHGLVE